MHHKVVAVIQKILHILEFIISVLTLIVLVGMLGTEIYKMCTVPGEYFLSLDHYLHSILTIVVGLEFVRMLIDLTPANTLEVLYSGFCASRESHRLGLQRVLWNSQHAQF